MPHILAPVCFAPTLLPLVQNVDCGSTLWGQAAAKWLKAPVTDSTGALAGMAVGNEVWLYYDGADLVGFGSLGTTTWRIPPPQGERTKLAYIPQIGILRNFQRCPVGAVEDLR
jgi:hypothetical protein